jgi:hypothetical protein
MYTFLTYALRMTCKTPDLQFFVTHKENNNVGPT